MLTAANASSQSAGATTTVRCPSLTLTKTADAAVVRAGQAIGFTITVSNGSAGGTGTAHAVVLDDPLPAGPRDRPSIQSGPANCSIQGSPGSEILHCTPVDVAPGGSESVHVVSTTTAAGAGRYANTATVTAANHPLLTASAESRVVAPTVVVAPGGSCTLTNPFQGTIRLTVADVDSSVPA